MLQMRSKKGEVAKKVVYLATGDWAVEEEDIPLAVEQQGLEHPHFGHA